MSSCPVSDPLGAQAIRRLGHLSGHGDEDILGESSSYIYFQILIVSSFVAQF
jgi:hypothetical protein